VKPSDFVHLHCHSTYSLLEGLPIPEEIVLRAKELEQTAVGLADRGYTYGLIEFHQYATKHGVKPILGMEAFVAARTRKDRDGSVDAKSTPLTLLAATTEGYENLLQLATEAALEGMYYKPRVDAELLAKYGKGLIALTGPITSAIGQAAIAEDGERITALTEQYRSFFGEENVYFELMDIPTLAGQAEVNQQLIAWGKKLKVPVVASCNSYYCRREDVEAHDVLLCIQKNALIQDEGRFSMRDHDYAMRAFADMEAAFGHIPEALENTRAIAERCNISIPFGVYQIPKFPTPNGKSEPAMLRELCEEGFKQRYPKNAPAERERLDYELSVIEKMGFSGYFLIVGDFVTEARRRGITVGPGRGSAAGSIVSYCMGITTLDPLAHGLLFERFLNPERITLPDIDTDFADNRRDEVLEYVRGKYGADRVVQICTFGTLAARAAVKDVGRVYGIPFLEMNALAKLIPDRPGTKLKDALALPELKAACEGNTTYRKIMDTALKLEGKARHVSVHACGVIISPKPATHYTATQRAPKDETTVITQYSAKPIESLGLLKMDFLGLMNLTVIQTALSIIKHTRGVEIDMATVPLDDPKTYQLLQRGETTGVFQFESAGMRRYLRQLKPTSFNDITAMAALYRPGPMEWIPSYIKRKHKQEEVSYLHPSLEPIFRETYGIGVYQEQILQLARAFAGYSLGEADILRRAIGKKIKKELDAQHDKFIEGAIKQGNDKKLSEKIFTDVILPFAGYGFPKAHSAGYARIAFETAYLKAHYPAEFMASLLTADAQRTDQLLKEIEECRAMGIAVMPPDINESFADFTVVTPGDAKKKEEPRIRFGLAAIKGIGESSVKTIIDERARGGKFTTIEDFARRLPGKILNKKFIESLAKSGALDSLGERRMLIENYDRISDYGKATGSAGAGQADLFAASGDAALPPIEFPESAPALASEKLAWEKETLGLYVSSHPLAGMSRYIGKKAQLIGHLTTKEVGKKVTLAGIAESVKKITTKKGDTMAVVTLEDPTGKIEVTLFPRAYGDFAPLLDQPDTVLVTGGTIDFRAGQLQLKVDAMKRSSLSTMIERAKSEGLFDEEEAKRGVVRMRTDLDDEETMELVDEEGNVVAGEVMRLEEKKDDAFGPIGQWILAGMPMETILQTLGFTEEKKKEAMPSKKMASTKSSPAAGISVHTIPLPTQAPKQLLLELKHVFETFPGREKIQLKIGEQLVPLPLTITMSPILEKKIEEVIAKFSGETVG
jgi:DNA polymerase-3 subunit alpha